MLTGFFASRRGAPMRLAPIMALAAVLAALTANGPAAAVPADSPAAYEEARQALLTHAGRKPIQSVTVTATGYTAGIESTGKRPGDHGYGITYSGVRVRRDHVSTIAADPKVFPIGTLLYVPGYGYGVVADTGSAIKGNKIDLYFETTHQVYKQWGKRNVQVDVWIQGDGKLKESWLKELNQAIAAGKLLPTEKVES